MERQCSDQLNRTRRTTRAFISVSIIVRVIVDGRPELQENTPSSPEVQDNSLPSPEVQDKYAPVPGMLILRGIASMVDSAMSVEQAEIKCINEAFSFVD